MNEEELAELNIVFVADQVDAEGREMFAVYGAFFQHWFTESKAENEDGSVTHTIKAKFVK